MVTTLSADRLAQLQDEDAEFTLVDTRPADSFESWHISGAIHFPFGPEEDIDSRLEEFEETIGGTERVITTCAKGISSGNLATQLESATGYDVQALDGGMKEWSGVYDRVELDVGTDLTVVQVQRRAKGCLGYVIGCENGRCRRRRSDRRRRRVRDRRRGGISVVGVIDTHVHADHVSGGRELADRLEVPYYLGERATERGVDVEYMPLERNEVLSVGTRELKALPAPGHTSEMINLLVDDRALLTADTLHADSTGRTELEFSEDDGERGARMLYETLHRTVLTQPGDHRPPGPRHGHLRRRVRTRRPGKPITTTVGAARMGIDLLALEAFVDRMADAGEAVELRDDHRPQPWDARVTPRIGSNSNWGRTTARPERTDTSGIPVTR